MKTTSTHHLSNNVLLGPENFYAHQNISPVGVLYKHDEESLGAFLLSCLQHFERYPHSWSVKCARPRFYPIVCMVQ